jgi:hypothetical protein
MEVFFLFFERHLGFGTYCVRCSVTGVNCIDITCGQLKPIKESMETIFKQWRRTSETILLLWNPVAANLVGMAYSCCLWKIDESWWCVINVMWLLILTLHWTVTNWSSLETSLQSVRWFKVRADLNTLNQLQVIWSTEPTWNICIIWNFSSVINLNKRGSNETLVGIMIQTSVLRDRKKACYQLSHAASLELWSYQEYCRCTKVLNNQLQQ